MLGYLLLPSDFGHVFKFSSQSSPPWAMTWQLFAKRDADRRALASQQPAAAASQPAIGADIEIII